jgi:magnesium-transporting ATPase (P-type)
MPNLAKNFQHPYKRVTEQNLLDYSSRGYRTLVFGCKYLTPDEYDEIKTEYERAMNSGKRKEEIKKLALKTETNLTLLGTTIVEDSLQAKVKETITRLLEADIKVWMITGDKLETAENIGLMSGIVTKEMRVFNIGKVKKEHFIAHCKKIQSQIAAHGDEKTAIILDMRGVGKAITDTRLHFHEAEEKQQG